MKNIIYITLLACGMSASSCVGDLDQYPHMETTSKQVYTSAANYKAVLGKIYASMVTIGQEKGGNADLDNSTGYDYMRCFFNLQEAGTDEVAYTWLSGDNMNGLVFLQWDANDPWVSDMYYRLFYNIALCNEFLRNATDDRISHFSEAEQSEIKLYRAEARFMRALFYYHALDLYRNIPFITENDPVSGYIPPRYTSAQIFDYIESELKDCVGNMYNATECPYGRASQGAAYTLLAKLYLNAEVYIKQPKYTECIEACKNVIAQGYSLEDDYKKLFNADNDKRTNEIIFGLPVDAATTVSWGSSTYVVCGAVSNSGTQVPADYGVTAGWGNMRARGELPKLFKDTNDKRYCFYTDGQTEDVADMADISNGYLVTKWTNLKDDGTTAASNTADGGVNTDYPLFRLADVYLMMAEAVLRNGQGSDRETVRGYVNLLQKRAYGDDKHSISDTDLTLNFILKERGRELYWEGTRRTDLIRFGEFTGSSYLWQWKGGVQDGTAVDDKYAYYPIPSTELTANPNLYNENY